MTRTPVMLSVAGSDPSGGAGIQADLKTASAIGVYGAAVLTALTVQNTLGVTGIHAVPARFVADQYASVVTDLDVRAVKIGMLGGADVVEAVASMLREHPVPVVVLDPVMVATSGDRLVPEDAVAAIRELLVPLASVVTPNVPELAVLTGLPVASPDDLEAAARALLGAGPGAVLAKGGHLDGDRCTDVLVTADGAHHLDASRVRTRHTHGTGCTLSSAIASYLVLGLDLVDAVTSAKAYLHRALVAGASLELGGGNGPVDHRVPA
ncbi:MULTISPECIES: bifunctional hydroxymethylpyrimidine kinase/phosphomethylpyrimidine kinase [Aeromicrobium]|uniref:bifunctional hydroxymethylpyrimidine kinase/phosphomethylpyrimidine kinase n=1 Tax=Aeromicrobium TaxID=2040 RepID=UPI0006F65D8D|nr:MULTISPECIES: bifunctional hydroxymethylpyrimidine kinase/phosphomethylpyrimidine kinase [Aeromicrobium]KQX76265.1 hydroxymethylpyrimidine/phosphomethylpyrimidine kinase [Aeromicrobium sp. Root472D3]MCL8251330.1 bifunctional hydroxymethylpyrimidine kinase/phosphomethylpyrimidine kinase [Aeromicrobium fastidiosum]